MDEKDESSQPLIIQMILEIVDVVSVAEYKKIKYIHKDEVFYMTHTLIAYVFNCQITSKSLLLNPKNQQIQSVTKMKQNEPKEKYLPIGQNLQVLPLTSQERKFTSHQV